MRMTLIKANFFLNSWYSCLFVICVEHKLYNPFLFYALDILCFIFSYFDFGSSDDFVLEGVANV